MSNTQIHGGSFTLTRTSTTIHRMGDRAGICELLGKCGGGLLFQPGNPKHLARLLMDCDSRGMRMDPCAIHKTWISGLDASLNALDDMVSLALNVGACCID